MPGMKGSVGLKGKQGGSTLILIHINKKYQKVNLQPRDTLKLLPRAKTEKQKISTNLLSLCVKLFSLPLAMIKTSLKIFLLRS